MILGKHLKKFTIHFATINTCNDLSSLQGLLQFTIHFATINTYNFQESSPILVFIYNTLCYY